MRELLNRRPDQPLPPGRHDQLRAELLDEIEADQPRQSRRMLVPVAAAAAVFAVAAGLALAVPALRKDDTGMPVAGGGQPVVRDLSAADTAALQKQCLAEADRITVKQLPRPFRSYQPVRAFEFVDVKDPKVVKTWLIAKGKADEWQDGQPAILPPGQGYWLCSRTAGGVISESSIRTPLTDKLVQLPVRPLARNAGVVAAPVVRVTVELAGRPAQEAFLLDGFWFAPTEGRTNWGPYDTEDPAARTVVIRGYDAGGQQIFANTDKHPNCQPAWVVAGKQRAKPVQTDPPEPECPTFRWPS